VCVFLSRSSKVVDFGTNRKRVCDFLLILHSNVGALLTILSIGTKPMTLDDLKRPKRTLVEKMSYGADQKFECMKIDTYRQ